MAVSKEDQEKKTSIFERIITIFTEEEVLVEVSPSQEEKNDFLSMTQQLKQQTKKELEETKGLHHDIIDWIARVFIHKFRMDETALADRILNKFVGESTPDSDGE